MKNTIRSIRSMAAFAFAAAALVSCQQENLVPEDGNVYGNGKITIDITTAETLYNPTTDTKTAIEQDPLNEKLFHPKWTANETLYMWYTAGDNPINALPTLKLANAAEGAVANFKNTFNGNELGASQGNWNLYSFATSFESYCAGTVDGKPVFYIPSEQTPVTGSFDSDADLLVATPLSFIVTPNNCPTRDGNGAPGTDCSMDNPNCSHDHTWSDRTLKFDNVQFCRPLAVVRVLLDNASTKVAAADKIISLTLASTDANVALAGKVVIDVVAEVPSVVEQRTKEDVSAVFPEGFDNAEGVYLVVNPATFASGTGLDLTVETQQGYKIRKHLDLSGKSIKPSAVTRINVSFTDENVSDPISADPTFINFEDASDIVIDGNAAALTLNYSYDNAWRKITVSVPEWIGAELKDGKLVLSVTENNDKDGELWTARKGEIKLTAGTVASQTISILQNNKNEEQAPKSNWNEEWTVETFVQDRDKAYNPYGGWGAGITYAGTEFVSFIDGAGANESGLNWVAGKTDVTMGVVLSEEVIAKMAGKKFMFLTYRGIDNSLDGLTISFAKVGEYTSETYGYELTVPSRKRGKTFTTGVSAGEKLWSSKTYTAEEIRDIDITSGNGSDAWGGGWSHFKFDTDAEDQTFTFPESGEVMFLMTFKIKESVINNPNIVNFSDMPTAEDACYKTFVAKNSTGEGMERVYGAPRMNIIVRNE